MEIIVACPLMDTEKGGADDEQKKTPIYPFDGVKRGGMIGAAALAGGTLMAITGGMRPANNGRFKFSIFQRRIMNGRKFIIVERQNVINDC